MEDMSDPIVKRGIKDSVFTSLFRDSKYVLQLYQALFPENKTVTAADIETITLEYDLVNEYYNDLGFLVGNQLIVLVEAQSEWSDNIIIRVFLYLAQTWKNYIDSHDELDLHSTRKITLPKPEFFVIYTGSKKDVKDVITYSGEFLNGEDANIDIRVKVIRDGKEGDIINQYVRFTKVLAEQIKRYGRTRKAIMETIRICKDENILKEYLQSREEEVVNIMISLYDYESTFNKRIKYERFYAKQAGIEAGKKAGKEEQARESALELYKNNVPIEVIAVSLHRSVDTVKQWLDLAAAQ